jgi:ribosomal protein S18 acetylase RimI-like enzyme
MVNIRRLMPEDLPRLRRFWKERWGDEFVVAHGVVYRPDLLDGFLMWEAGEIIGLITVAHAGDACEIVSLDSLREDKGIGSALIQAVVRAAREKGCRRLFLITTNDNLRALGFFQKRGFEISAVNRGAINESRKIKPGIPLIGENGIPLRDEIELEMKL